MVATPQTAVGSALWFWSRLTQQTQVPLQAGRLNSVSNTGLNMLLVGMWIQKDWFLFLFSDGSAQRLSPCFHLVCTSTLRKAQRSDTCGEKCHRSAQKLTQRDLSHDDKYNSLKFTNPKVDKLVSLAHHLLRERWSAGVLRPGIIRQSNFQFVHFNSRLQSGQGSNPQPAGLRATP